MNDRKRTARYGFAFIILAVLLVILFIWNVNAGSIPLSVGEILNIIFRHQGEQIPLTILYGKSVCPGSWLSLSWEEPCPYPDFSCRLFSITL